MVGVMELHGTLRNYTYGGKFRNFTELQFYKGSDKTEQLWLLEKKQLHKKKKKKFYFAKQKKLNKTQQ